MEFYFLEEDEISFIYLFIFLGGGRGGGGDKICLYAKLINLDKLVWCCLLRILKFVC
jgi:hypothetical protein